MLTHHAGETHRDHGVETLAFRPIQMKIVEGRVWLAAGDVANFMACRRLTQLEGRPSRIRCRCQSVRSG
jgi:hypothetical protein